MIIRWITLKCPWNAMQCTPNGKYIASVEVEKKHKKRHHPLDGPDYYWRQPLRQKNALLIKTKSCCSTLSKMLVNLFILHLQTGLC